MSSFWAEKEQEEMIESPNSRHRERMQL